MILTANQLRIRLAEAGITPEMQLIADARYLTATKAWMKDRFCPALDVFFRGFSAKVWTSEEHDCDDFARLGAGFAQLLHHRTRRKVTDCALAVGEFWYHQEGEGGHAIIIALVDAGEIVFLEPQGPRLITLTAKERKSCFAFRF